MNEFLAHLGENIVAVIFIVLVFGGGGAYNIVHKWTVLRAQRKLEEARHRHRIETLKERRLLAEATGEAMKLLLVDTALATDFDWKLRVSIAQEKKRVAALPPRSDGLDAYEEPEGAAPARTARSRKR